MHIVQMSFGKQGPGISVCKYSLRDAARLAHRRWLGRQLGQARSLCASLFGLSHTGLPAFGKRCRLLRRMRSPRCRAPPYSYAAQDALDIALKMALSIPLADIMAYRKVARAYFALLDVLCHNHAQVRSHPLSRTASSIAGAGSAPASLAGVGLLGREGC